MIYFESRADDGEGNADTVAAVIQTEVPEPTATPEPPGFEAVFAHFFFLENTFFLKKEPVLRKDFSLVKVSFLKKSLC